MKSHVQIHYRAAVRRPPQLCLLCTALILGQCQGPPHWHLREKKRPSLANTRIQLINCIWVYTTFQTNQCDRTLVYFNFNVRFFSWLHLLVCFFFYLNLSFLVSVDALIYMDIIYYSFIPIFDLFSIKKPIVSVHFYQKSIYWSLSFWLSFFVHPLPMVGF